MISPLLDKEFLHELDSYRNRITYARITSLTLDSYPIESVEGVVTDGNVTVDGNSAVRRICSLTMTTKNVNLNNVYWGVTTRVKIEIGIAKNFDSSINSIRDPGKYEYLLEKYEQYPDIIWFPLGVFILTDFKTSQQVNNYTITLSGKDKMCLLNGDIGGVFNAETDLGQEQIEQEDGSYRKVYRSIPYIIREMIHHYAQEPFNNIIIKDINELALEILKNNSDYDIYLTRRLNTDDEILDVIDSNSGTNVEGYVYADDPTTEVEFNNLIEDFKFAITTDEDDIGLITPIEEYKPTIIIKQIKDEEDNIIEKIYCTLVRVQPGEDVGYQLRELTYPEDLIAGIGETVTSVLDKIVKQFGNYEYFYNLDGQFVFQGKPAYINTKWNGIIRNYNENDEMWIAPSAVAQRVEYNFEGSNLTTAYQNTPNIGKVKNDYTVWGKKKSSSGEEIPIHMRYAIDLKPYFYKAFDGTIYISKDFNIDNIDNTDINNEYKVHELPLYLEDKHSWWHIDDWKNYYTAVTTKEPQGMMMSYQAASNKGFTEDLYFPNGKDNFESEANENRKLIIRFDNPPSNGEKEEYVVYIGKSPSFIFDVQSSGPYEGCPVGWTGWKDDSHTNPVRNPSGAFCHRFNGCYHNYMWFIQRAERDEYISYIYQPTIVNKEEIINKDKLLSNIIICDWREIIYQMAKDYYLHNHEDDFYYQLRLNNYLPNVGSGIILYQNGHTGYEQYYHDIEGFWRQLYLPDQAINNKTYYFDQFRTITATSIETNEDVIFQLKKIKNTQTYSLQYGEDKTYQYNLSQLINRDNLITEKEYLLNQKQQQLNIKIKIQNEFLKSEYLRTASTLYNNFIEQLNQLQTQYKNLMNNTIITQSMKEEERQQLYINIDTVFQQYQSEINNCIIDEENYIYVDTSIQLFKEIINLSSEIDQDIDNVMPGYTNIRYSCPNEESFYKKVVLTQRGFPVIEHFVDLDEEVYAGWNKDVFDDPSSLLFWFDFFDADSLGIGQFSVPAIGDRPKVVNNDAVRAIIYKDVPDVIFIKGSDYLKYDKEHKLLDGYNYIKITNDDDTETSFIYDYMNADIPKIIKSTRGITAQEQIDDLLYNFGYCNENITITSVPIYYLEPNTIISAKDEQRVVNGYYILSKMTLPLKYNGTMQINAIRVPERVY